VYVCVCVWGVLIESWDRWEGGGEFNSRLMLIFIFRLGCERMRDCVPTSKSMYTSGAYGKGSLIHIILASFNSTAAMRFCLCDDLYEWVSRLVLQLNMPLVFCFVSYFHDCVCVSEYIFMFSRHLCRFVGILLRDLSIIYSLLHLLTWYLDCWLSHPPWAWRMHLKETFVCHRWATAAWLAPWHGIQCMTPFLLLCESLSSAGAKRRRDIPSDFFTEGYPFRFFKKGYPSGSSLRGISGPVEPTMSHGFFCHDIIFCPLKRFNHDHSLREITSSREARCVPCTHMCLLHSILRRCYAIFKLLN
jgi:hypothetical protein